MLRFAPLHWTVRLLATAALAAMIFASVYLARETAPTTPQTEAPPVNWEAAFPARVEAVTASLSRLPWPMPTPGQEPQGAGRLRWIHRRYDLTLPVRQSAPALEEAFAPLHAAAPEVSVRVAEGATDSKVQVGVDGLLTHTIVLHWLGRHPRIAIVIEKLGDDLFIARQFVDIDAPLTLAVIPFRPFAKEVAELGAMFGREILLELPLEDGTGTDSTGRRVLRVAAGRSEIAHSLDEDLSAVPHRAGVIGPLSSFGNLSERMHWLVPPLSGKELFVIDSSVRGEAASCKAAAAAKIPCSVAGLKLQETDDEEAIAAQIDSVLEAAQTHADVIVIGQPTPSVITVLRAALPALAAAEIDVVPASVIARTQSLSPR